MACKQTQMGDLSSEKGKDYDEISKIGKGAYGTVYKAKDKQLNKYVALKKICVPLCDNGMPMNTLREVTLLKRLNTYEHPNIVRLLDVCHGQRLGKELTMFLVFEHLEQDLAAYINNHPNGFNVKTIRNLSREMLNGIHFLHSHRMVHRDIKPQNLLVTSEGHVKLADFGLAKAYDFDMKLTSVVVTLWYRAPEVLLRQTYATPVDIWSIGCIIVELYSLKPLFSGSSENNQISKILSVLGKPPENEWPVKNVSVKWFQPSQVTSLKEIAPNICETAEDLIMKMLTFNPEKRISALEALNHEYFQEEPMNT